MSETLAPQRRAIQRTYEEWTHERQADPHVNVGDAERLLSGVAGGVMVASGLTGRGGLLSALAGAALVYRGLTGHCHVYQALGQDRSGRDRAAATAVRATAGVKVETCLTIERQPDELYRFWQKLENLPSFMSHLESVKQTGPNQSHWVAKGPLGVNVEWDAEVLNGEADRMIAWRSLPGSQVDTAGSVHFNPAPGNRGTVVRVVMKYDPPGGKAGALIARLFGDAPEQQIREELRRFKQLMEAGEIPTTEGQTSCRAHGEQARSDR